MPRYPDADWRPSPNRTIGRPGARIRAVVLHISQGSYASGVDWLANPQSGVSAHFIVGEDGAVTQLVDTADTAWANGLTYRKGAWYNSRGRRVTPTWRLLTPDTPVNASTISIEHAGYTDRPRPPAQVSAVIGLLAWIARTEGLPPYVVGETLIGHAHLDSVDRPQCPGPHVDLAAYAAAANAHRRPATATAYAARTYVPVLESPGTGELQVAWGGRCVLPPGQVVEAAPGPDGWLHWPGGGFLEAAAMDRVHTLADRPILATFAGDPLALADAVADRCATAGSPIPRTELLAIVGHYAGICAQSGVSLPDALAQWLYETGNATAFWGLPPQRNMAGIGVTGATYGTNPDAAPRTPNARWNPQRGQWEEGLSFATWGDAVRAHVGRLIAYATRPTERTPAQADLVRAALAIRDLPDAIHGSAPTLRQLGAAHNATGAGWADPGHTYGEGVGAVARALLVACGYPTGVSP